MPVRTRFRPGHGSGPDTVPPRTRFRPGRGSGPDASSPDAALPDAPGSDAALGWIRSRPARAVPVRTRLRDLAKRVTGGLGAHVVYDGVGQATFDDSLAALRPRGMMALYGAASGQVPPFDPQRLNSGGSLFLTRPTMGHYIADRAELDWRAGELFTWIADGDLDVRIGGTYPLGEAARAQEDLAARRTTGKLLLLPVSSGG